MADPRNDNCRRNELDSAGKVTGVELVHLPNPTSKYELTTAYLRDEYAAQGQIIAKVTVLDQEGVDVVQARCFLAYPWVGWQPGQGMTERRLANNGNYPLEHMIHNPYNPPQQGPLSIYIGDVSGSVNSDVIAGLGLPYNRHVSFHLVYRERGGDVPPPDTGDLAEVLGMLDRIEAQLDRIGKHFT